MNTPICDFVREYAAKDGLVLSTGGGIVKNPKNIEYLKRSGRILWLKRDVEKLESGNGRPLAPTPEAVQKLYAERLPLYTAAAESILENNGTADTGLTALLAFWNRSI